MLQDWEGPSTGCRLSTWKGAGSMILTVMIFFLKMLKNSSLLWIALLTCKTITHSEDKFIDSGLCEGPGVCLYVVWAVSWEGPLTIFPDFMRNLSGRTVFGCTPTPCSMSLTQVLHLVIVWSWYSGFAFNSVGLLHRKILSLACGKKVLNPACIPPDMTASSKISGIICAGCAPELRNSLKHRSKTMYVFMCWN